MHAISFLQKRAHLCAVARGKEMFEEVEAMTPARFDILYSIHEAYLDCASRCRASFLAQAELRRLLGLARQTVWKMVERLVELGLVKKWKSPWGDRRHNLLSLTEEGLRRVRKAMGLAFTEMPPLPQAAPAEGEVPRYWRRPELADVRLGQDGQAQLPPKVGRELAKIFTAFAWNRTAKRPRKRVMHRYRDLLDRMIMYQTAIAHALGNTADSIYPIWNPDH